MHEQRVLSSLRLSGVRVPKVYAGFQLEGHYYLVMEYIKARRPTVEVKGLAEAKNTG